MSTPDDKSSVARGSSDDAITAGVKMDVLADFECPFCGGRAQLCKVRVSGDPAAVHTVPTCSAYDDMEPDEFATACRRAILGEVADA